jgi:hypothetical protein
VHVFITPFQRLKQLPIIMKTGMSFMRVADIAPLYINFLQLGMTLCQMPEVVR